ncbi:HD domain-containing phosphohydrolase [Aminomonas paucivorans]|uniref:HD domain-containing phosphohydrolase n=1 Tax=Aminomonas paucivorans TaxID=81412 RepID=UPI000309675B|nr:HD domain-containing phosphohydrolase [Aminomonas paucivorans]
MDDTPLNLQLLEDLLTGWGYRVLPFPRGDLALEAALRSAPDLILLDIVMPEPDGFEVCRRLKAHETLRDVPVIFLSSLEDPATKVSAFAVGGVDYVSKPFHAEEVRARVRTHLDLRRMRLELEQHTRRLEDLVETKVREISEAQLATITALSKLAASRDEDTGAHIERTAAYCGILAETLGRRPEFAGQIDGTFVENLRRAAPLHDIGKVGVPDRILLKPGKLSPEEFEVMKTHTLIGERTLRSALLQHPGNLFLHMGMAIARSHHERWDGSGYPDGLTGEEIPLVARIMAVADVYDALRSRRTYKASLSHEESGFLVQEGSGDLFDPSVVAAFREAEARFREVSEEEGEPE